jgi:hypothetical protein
MLLSRLIMTLRPSVSPRNRSARSIMIWVVLPVMTVVGGA